MRVIVFVVNESSREYPSHFLVVDSAFVQTMLHKLKNMASLKLFTYKERNPTIVLILNIRLFKIRNKLFCDKRKWSAIFFSRKLFTIYQCYRSSFLCVRGA